MTGEDGRCQSLYDVERRLVVPVPIDFEWLIETVLDSGDSDECSRGWLAGHDVLTFDPAPFPEPLTGSLDLRGASDDLGWISLENGAVHCRLTVAELSPALLASEYLGEPGSMVVFHLDLERVQSAAALARCIESGSSWGDERRREVVFQLSGRLDALDGLPADCLEPSAVHLRLVGCPAAREDGSLRHPDGETIAARIRTLAARMGDRLTIHAELAPRDRLRHLWAWAAASGVRRLDATRLEERSPAEHLDLAAGAREYAGDLERVGERIFRAHCEARRAPLYFLPLMRVVQKQQVAAANGPRPTVVALLRGGEPVRFQAGPERRAQLQSQSQSQRRSHGREPRGDGAPNEPCTACWARYLCAASAYAGVAEGERNRPQTDRCDVWKMEVEAGLRLFARLRAEDREHLLDFPLAPGLTPGLAPIAAVERSLVERLAALSDHHPPRSGH